MTTEGVEGGRQDKRWRDCATRGVEGLRKKDEAVESVGWNICTSGIERIEGFMDG